MMEIRLHLNSSRDFSAFADAEFDESWTRVLVWQACVLFYSYLVWAGGLGL